MYISMCLHMQGTIPITPPVYEMSGRDSQLHIKKYFAFTLDWNDLLLSDIEIEIFVCIVLLYLHQQWEYLF